MGHYTHQLLLRYYFWIDHWCFERLLTMASKSLLLLSLIVVILIASEVAARDLADSSAENKNNGM